MVGGVGREGTKRVRKILARSPWIDRSIDRRKETTRDGTMRYFVKWRSYEPSLPRLASLEMLIPMDLVGGTDHVILS